MGERRSNKTQSTIPFSQRNQDGIATYVIKMALPYQDGIATYVKMALPRMLSKGPFSTKTFATHKL